MLQAKILTNYPEIIHFFGDKNDTSSLLKLGIKLDNIITGEQVHGNQVVIIKNEKTKFIKGIDGMITDKSLILGIRTADCLPIFFYNPKKKIIAAIHAGWKGLYADIIENTVVSMKKLGSKPQNIKVAIGPHIKSCCYNVDYDRIENFKGKYKFRSDISEFRDGKNYLDLGKITFMQLVNSGMSPSNIEVFNICTSCDLRFWSFRRDKQNAQRMINFIGLH